MNFTIYKVNNGWVGFEKDLKGAIKWLKKSQSNTIFTDIRINNKTTFRVYCSNYKIVTETHYHQMEEGVLGNAVPLFIENKVYLFLGNLLVCKKDDLLFDDSELLLLDSLLKI